MLLKTAICQIATLLFSRFVESNRPYRPYRQTASHTVSPSLHQMHVPVCVCAAANDTLRCQASVGCQKTFLFYFLFLSSVTVDLVSVHVCLAVF